MKFIWRWSHNGSEEEDDDEAEEEASKLSWALYLLATFKSARRKQLKK